MALAVLVGILAIPVDYHVSAPLVLLPEDAARVYATVEGTLEKICRPARKWSAARQIGTLANMPTQLELARSKVSASLRQMRVEHLEKLRGGDPEANDQLPTAQMSLADSKRRLEERRNEAERLTLTAPADGVVIPAPRHPADQANDNHLASWSGSLLDPEALGAHVKPGTLTCLVGDPQRLTAVLLVDDVDVKFLQPGQRARLRIDQLPGQVIEGEVVEVARHETNDPEQSKAVRAPISRPCWPASLRQEQTAPTTKLACGSMRRRRHSSLAGAVMPRWRPNGSRSRRAFCDTSAQTFRLPM